MAASTPLNYTEAMQKLLQQIAASMSAPDANLDELAELQKQVLSIIRKPVDTPTQGSPVGSAQNLSNGAAPPAGPAPGMVSPMEQALLMAAGGGMGAAPSGPAPAPAGSFPTHGLMASPATAGPGAPDLGEVRRMITAPHR